MKLDEIFRGRYLPEKMEYKGWIEARNILDFHIFLFMKSNPSNILFSVHFC